jgi:hypothetical protein
MMKRTVWSEEEADDAATSSETEIKKLEAEAELKD